MKLFKIVILTLSLFLVSNCEKQKNPENLTTDAKIVGFVTEKCYCCWGWVIEIGSQTIKSDSVPGLSLSDTIEFPIDVRITTGTKSRDCSDYKINMSPAPDFYEIKSCTVIR